MIDLSLPPTRCHALGCFGGIESAEYARRRRALCAAIGGDSLALIAARPNAPGLFPPRQNSHFQYLTGGLEAGAMAVFAPGRAQGEFILFCQPRSPERERWEGELIGPERAPDLLGADEAWPVDRFDEIFASLLQQRSQLLTPQEIDSDLLALISVQVSASARRKRSFQWEWSRLDTLIERLRVGKSEAEQALLEDACAISAAGHIEAMRRCRPGMTEKELAAWLGFVFAGAGGAHAFPPIVGGGAHACVLHYKDNEGTLKDGDLVLVDAGAERDGYCGDLSRTYPVGAKFSDPQRQLYEIVLVAQKAALALAVPGQTVAAMHEAASRSIFEGLIGLGILPSGSSPGAERAFFMHRTSHWIGIEVHDPGAVEGSQAPPLEPGMALTVEPGIYIAGDAKAPQPYGGIGIRIEDVALITEQGPRILTADVAKEIDDVERLRGESL